MTPHPAPGSECCAAYERAAGLSRRRFLGGLAAAGAATVGTSIFGQAVRQASFAASGGGNVLVVVSLRGGMDGLGMVVPHGDPAYYAARPKLAVPRSTLLAQDSMFGLHPRLAPLTWLWESGELAAVQAVGLPVPNRSHFSAMEEVEDADPGSRLRRGWVNRMVGLHEDGAAWEAVNLGSATPPAAHMGSAPTVATAALSEIALTGTSNGWGPARRTELATTWDGVPGPLGDAARSALATVDRLGPVGARPHTTPVRYPTEFPATDLAAALKDTARLIKADVGTEVVTVDYGSWDMHANYGRLDLGDMQRMTSGFAQSLDAFMRDLGPLRERVTVVTISEFGRRVAENANGGLDHGWGNMMLVMGGGVRGGRYYGTWPGLGAGRLVDGDLKVTTDYRQVLGEVVHTRFPAKDVTQVFPALAYSPLGVMRSPSS